MSAMEIALLVLGAVFFAASFIVPEMRAASEDAGISKDEMKQMLEKELNSAKSQMKDTVEETVSYAVQRTERSLEKVSNEKIMAVNEYSDTVLEEIDKNHKEALFLYDMLNDKIMLKFVAIEFGCFKTLRVFIVLFFTFLYLIQYGLCRINI